MKKELLDKFITHLTSFKKKLTLKDIRDYDLFPEGKSPPHPLIHPISPLTLMDARMLPWGLLLGRNVPLDSLSSAACSLQSVMHVLLCPSCSRKALT